MSLTVPGTITGAAVSGLTSPTYTVSPDSSGPDYKAYVVTACGGTQTGVVAHSNNMPFRITIRRPKTLKVPGARSSSTGAYLQTGKNQYEVVIAKGVNLLSGMSGYQYENIVARVSIGVPAACGNDLPQVKAMCSILGGILNSLASGFVDFTQDSVLP